MFAAETIDAGMIEALWITLMRARVIRQDQLLATADEIDDAARHIESEEERDRQHAVARALRCILLHVDGAPEPASEMRAQFQRRQMRERTALIERAAKPDGGNDRI